MPGHQKFATLREKMPPDRRDRYDERVRELRQEMLLSELRRHSGMTQKELAVKLGISQPSLSQMEGQTDMQISTLQRLVESLGGKLELVVRLPSGEVSLEQFRSPAVD